MQFWIFIALVAVGTFSGYVYRQKGRSAVAGFLAGFLLGPIGVFLTVFSSYAQPRCPFCRERIQPGAVVCSHCGRNVKGKLLPPPTARTDYRLMGLLVTLAFIAFIVWVTAPQWLGI